jgi:predicted anti-sigma-YlaC factor YlaD
MTEHLTTQEMEDYSDLQSRRNMPSRMVEHLRNCDVCFQSYMDIRSANRKFPIIIHFDELSGLNDWHLQGEELEAYLYGEMNDEFDIEIANLHLEDCRDCRMKVTARLKELEALGAALYRVNEVLIGGTLPSKKLLKRE